MKEYIFNITQSTAGLVVVVTDVPETMSANNVLAVINKTQKKVLYSPMKADCLDSVSYSSGTLTITLKSPAPSIAANDKLLVKCYTDSAATDISTLAKAATIGAASDTAAETNSSSLFAWVKKIRDYLYGIVTTSPYAKEKTLKEKVGDCIIPDYETEYGLPVTDSALTINDGGEIVVDSGNYTDLDIGDLEVGTIIRVTAFAGNHDYVVPKSVDEGIVTLVEGVLYGVTESFSVVEGHCYKITGMYTDASNGETTIFTYEEAESSITDLVDKTKDEILESLGNVSVDTSSLAQRSDVKSGSDTAIGMLKDSTNGLAAIKTSAASAATDAAAAKTAAQGITGYALDSTVAKAATIGSASDTAAEGTSSSLFAWVKKIRDYLYGIVTTSPYAKEATLGTSSDTSSASTIFGKIKGVKDSIPTDYAKAGSGTNVTNTDIKNALTDGTNGLTAIKTQAAAAASDASTNKGLLQNATYGLDKLQRSSEGDAHESNIIGAIEATLTTAMIASGSATSGYTAEVFTEGDGGQFTVEPNKVYIFPDRTSTLELTLDADPDTSEYNSEYHFIINVITDIQLDLIYGDGSTNVYWAFEELPALTAGHTYEIGVLCGMAVFNEYTIV